MKTTQVDALIIAAVLSLSTTAAPTTYAAPADYPAPPGGWESVHYPDGTGENLANYPAPPGGWESVKYPDTDCPTNADGLFRFTSTYHVQATPDQVVNGTAKTGGLAGAKGTYDLGINSDLDLICWKITLTDFRGDYSSPARTATHIHQARFGQSGPPRIVFPNPAGDGNVKVSAGCMTGPFTTGLMTNGKDNGDGFKVKQIEDDPAGFFADVHSTLAVPGAVRGQLG